MTTLVRRGTARRLGLRRWSHWANTHVAELTTSTGTFSLCLVGSRHKPVCLNERLRVVSADTPITWDMIDDRRKPLWAPGIFPPSSLGSVHIGETRLG